MVPEHVKQNEHWRLVSVKNKTQIGKASQAVKVGQLVSTYNREEYWLVLDVFYDFVLENERQSHPRTYCNMYVKRMLTKLNTNVNYQMYKFGDIITDIWVHGKPPAGVSTNFAFYNVIAEPE